MIQQNSQPPFNTLVWGSLKLAPVSWSISYQSVYWLQCVHSCHNDPRPLDHGTNREKLTPTVVPLTTAHAFLKLFTCGTALQLPIIIYECVPAMGNHKAPVVYIATAKIEFATRCLIRPHTKTDSYVRSRGGQRSRGGWPRLTFANQVSLKSRGIQ